MSSTAFNFENVAKIIWGRDLERNAGFRDMSPFNRAHFMALLKELRSDGWLTPRPIHIKLLLEVFHYEPLDWTPRRLKTICKNIGNLSNYPTRE